MLKNDRGYHRNDYVLFGKPEGRGKDRRIYIVRSELGSLPLYRRDTWSRNLSRDYLGLLTSKRTRPASINRVLKNLNGNGLARDQRDRIKAIRVSTGMIEDQALEC